MATNSQENVNRTWMYLSIGLMAAAVLGLGSSFLPLQAFAATPANDDFDSATSVGAAVLPFTDTLNTGEATTAADDPDCNGNGATVWYVFTPSENIHIGANTFGSDYDTTLSVYTGSRGALTQIACNDDSIGNTQSKVKFDAVAGETYYLMIASFAGGPGGNLLFSMDILPPPLTFDVTIDSVGKVDAKTGVATISGTFTCSREGSGFIDVSLQQTIGRSKGFGSEFTNFTCDGVTKWSIPIQGNILFVGGRANVSAFAVAFDEINEEVVIDEASRTVRLMGTR